MKKIAVCLGGLAAGIFVAGAAHAGPGSVEIQTIGDIKIKMGAQIRIVPTGEIDRDFGLSDGLGANESKAASAMRALGVGTDSTRVHLNEAGGAIKDDHIRGENRLFFNFSHGQDWDVYMALESDTVLDRKSADRTDFSMGRQSQQFGIERLLATFNISAISSRLEAGWDARGVDIGYGGLVYGDDDPGIGIVGKANGFTWEARYLKKDEDEAGYYTDIVNNAPLNPIGSPTQDKDSDRTFWYGKAGYDFSGTYLEAFYMLDRNTLNTMEAERNFTGLQGKGTYGIVKPLAEVVYSFGDYKKDDADMDIDSWAAFADVAFDLKDVVGLKVFEPHIGGYWVKGDDDQTDDDLEGFTPAVGIMQFTPRYGSQQSITMDGNPILGQTLYSFLPAYYGKVRAGGINGQAALDNPGFRMIGGGLTAGYGKWTYVTNVMAMWFDEPEAVEAYYNTQALSLNQSSAFNSDIDDFMGVEWNNEIRYKLYDAVTLKGGVAFLFPGSGAEDITKALNAIANGVDFEEGEKSDDISTRVAAELLWFF